MPSHNEILIKNKSFIHFNNNNNYSHHNMQGNNCDTFDDYLVQNFDTDILDLDEDKLSDDEQDLDIINHEQKYIANKQKLDASGKAKSEIDSCTIIGTNCFGKKIPYLLFSVETVLRRDSFIRKIGEKYNLTYKIHKTDCKLLKTILNSHGFQECQSYSNDYNLLWTGGHVRPYTLRTMQEFQKINHFPQSQELTRKDRLFKNIQKMQQLKGLKHFDFVPPSYLIPSEFQELCHNFSKEKNIYIVKPIALSRGRGIFLCNNPSQIPLNEELIVSKYISNPYLINELKFDIRMYVLVTSFDPLVVYLYEEGLTRFATVKYQNVAKNIKSQCMHLTNYSVNKKSNSFVQNKDADKEDFGNKWSLGALLRYFKSKNIDTTCLMMKIEDIIIKSLIAVETPIAATCRMFQQYRSNCFELYGYDIIIDENLRPWLLEVNLSPSLSCDSPLDFKIKSHMLSDMFSLIGIGCEDTTSNNQNQSFSNSKLRSSLNQSCSAIDTKSSKQGNNQNVSIRRPTAGLHRRTLSSNIVTFKSDQLRLVRRFKEEYKRKGGWIRIFPTTESLETYFPLFVSNNFEQNNSNASCGIGIGNQTNFNKLLYFKLFPNCELETEILNRTNAQNLSNFKSRISLHSINYNSSFHNGILSQLFPSSQLTYKRVLQNYTDTNSRIPYYERRLGEDALVMENFPKKGNSEINSRNKIQMTDLNKIVQDSDNEMMSSSSSFSTSEKDVNNSDLDADVEDEEENSTNSRNIPSSMSQTCKDIIAIDQIIQHGGKLTKIQARMAFSCYLTRVQQRLLLECKSEECSYVTCTNSEDSHDQLELILRFLKRAALNMSEKFAIPVIPEKSQSLGQRQEWLAKLLGGFIKIYSQETLVDDTNQTDTTFINKKTFLSFLRLASESELEQTLSNYTRVNKSACIFLNLNSQLQNVPISSDSKKPQYPTFGLRKSSSMKNLSKPYIENIRKPLQQSQQLISKPLTTKTQSSLQLNKDNTASKSIAVDQQLLSRPTSVNQIWKPGSTRLTINNCRPVTSNVANNRLKMSNKNDNFYDPEAISKALQRLAVDQKNRHLTASVFPFYDANLDQQISTKNSPNFDPLTQTLIRQYQQSRQLLHESRAKHNALLKQTSTRSSELSTTNNNNNNNNNINKVQLVNKPPPGLRTIATGSFHFH